MPTLRLSLRDIHEPLPDVCLVCGQDATIAKDKTFAWHPPWVWVTLLLGLVPFAIIALVLTKRVKIQAPLCHEHRYHWALRTATILLGIFVLLGGAIACINVPSETVAGWCWIAWFVALMAWLSMAVVLSTTAVRVVSITDHDIDIAGVALQFVDAMDNWGPARRGPRDYLGPYRLRPPTADDADDNFDVPEKRTSSETPKRVADDDVNIRDKSRRSTPPDDRIRE